MEAFVALSDVAVFPFARGRPVTDGISRERLERLFKDHHESVWRTLRRLGLTSEAAADATQQAFLIAAERVDDIHHGSERAFLFGTAIRLARGMRRSSARIELDADMDQRESASSRPEELVDRRRAMTAAERILGQMEQSLLEVFVLFELEGLTTPEIAELVGVPLGTAASRLRRARESFREMAARLERSQRSAVVR